MVSGVRGCIEEGRTNNRMQRTAPIGARISAVTRACRYSCGKGAFPHPARRLMRVPFGRRCLEGVFGRGMFGSLRKNRR